MKTIFSFLLGLLCLLVSSTSNAEPAYYKCSASVRTEYKNGEITKGGASREFWAGSEADALLIAQAYWATVGTHQNNPVLKISVEKVKCAKARVSLKKLESERKPAVAPPLPAAKVPAAPLEREWRCRVKTTWHFGKKSKNEDIVIVVESATESGATGLALMRVQARIKALFDDANSRRVTFTRTDVTCE